MASRSLLRMTGLLALTGLFSLTARADEFAFSYYSVVYNYDGALHNAITSASGVFTTTNTEVNGAVMITGITGARTVNYSFMQGDPIPPETDTITGLLPPGDTGAPFPPTDNLLYLNAANPLDHEGFAYQLNCYYCGSNGPGGVVQVVEGNGANINELGSETIFPGAPLVLTPIPEPATLGLFSVSAVALAFHRVRRAGTSNS